MDSLSHKYINPQTMDYEYNSNENDFKKTDAVSQKLYMVIRSINWKNIKKKSDLNKEDYSIKTELHEKLNELVSDGEIVLHNIEFIIDSQNSLIVKIDYKNNDLNKEETYNEAVN